MARPVKRRNVKSYQRDIEALGRLRTALVMDSSLDWTLVKSTIENIDSLMRSLRDLSANATAEKALE